MRVCSSMHGVKTCPSWKATGRCPVMVVEDFTVLRVSLWDVPRQFTAAYTVPLRRIVNKTTRRGTHAAELLRHFFSLPPSPFSFSSCFSFFSFSFFFVVAHYVWASLISGPRLCAFFLFVLRRDLWDRIFLKLHSHRHVGNSDWNTFVIFFSFKKQIKQERIISIFRVIFMFFNFEIFLGDN